MLLKALVDQGGTGTPPGYALKTVSFVLEVDSSSRCRLVSLLEPRLDRNQRPTAALVGRESLVPNITRSNNPPPMLACDNAAFVLGLAKTAKDLTLQDHEDAVAARKQESFMALLADYHASSGDEAAGAVLGWYRAGRPGLDGAIDALQKGERQRLDTDLVALRYEEDMARIHDKPEAVAFWGRRAVVSKAGKGPVGLCLSCGQVGPLVDTLPQSLVGRLIPATSTANVALVSGNFPSAQRGASGTGLRSAPLCATCAIKAVDSFNVLAGPGKHRWGRPGEDRGTIWWLRGGTEDDEEATAQLEDPSPGWVLQFLNTLHKPASGTGRNLNMKRFYALTFSGNVARLVVRGWVDLPLTEYQEHIGKWFNDVECASDTHPYPSLSAAAASLGVLVRREGKWTEPAPEGAREALLRAALAGHPVPRNFLRLGVTRAKAELGYTHSTDGLTAAIARRRMHARLGLLRLILNRTVYQEDPMPSHLDPGRDDKPYLSGRLFAIREALQHRAVRAVNASIADRYFDRASANPASVDGNLTTLERQHLRALLRLQSSRGAAVHFDKLVTDLHARMGDAPGRLTLEEQAAWIAGYYQQRQHDFSRFDETSSRRPTEDGTDQQQVTAGYTPALTPSQEGDDA